MRAVTALFATTLLLVSTGASAMYCPLSFQEMLQNADLVVTGTIASLGEHIYDFEIAEVYKGQPQEKQITVTRFRDWVCARRPPEPPALTG